MKERTLKDIVRWVLATTEDQLSMKTICAREPWSADSAARIVDLDAESRLPPDAQQDGFRYFLEASVAREVLDVVPVTSGASDAELCDIVIYYAQNDAYPGG